MQEAVTVVGLGSMGRALAGAFLAAGRPTTVWNRSPDKAAPLVEEGAVLAPRVADAVAASPITVVCVLDTPTVLEVVDAAGEALRDKVVVNLATGTPEDARRIERRVLDHNGSYLDGAIMAVPAMIGTPEAMILYSGSRAAYETHEPTLGILAASSPLVGEDAGSAARYDVAMLALLYSNMVGWLQAYAMVRAGGLDLWDFQPYAESWFTNVVAAEDSRLVAEDIADGRYPDRAGSSLTLNAMGLALVARAFAEDGLPASTFGDFAERAERRVAAGHGADGFTSLFETIAGGR